MSWRDLEATLVNIARELGFYLDEDSRTGDKWVDVNGAVNLTDFAKRLSDHVEPATKRRRV